MNKLERQLSKGIHQYQSGDIKAAEQTFRRIHRDEPLNVQARFYLGAVYLGLQQPNKAVPLLEPVVAEHPNWADAHNNLGIAYHRLKRYDDALREYTKAAEIAPKMASAVMNRVYCLAEMGEKEAALEGIERAIEESPDNIQARLDRAILLTELTRDEDARKAGLEILEISDLTVEQLSKIGLLLYDRDTNGAIQAFERLIELEPREVTAQVRLACLLERTINVDTREEIYNRMLGIVNTALGYHPEFLDALLNKAAILQKLGRSAEMMEIFESVKSRAEGRADYHTNYGAALMEITQYDAAIEQFKTAVKHNPQSANAYYNWGASLQLMGNYDGALEMYTKALEIEPDHINSRTARSLQYLVLGKFEEGWADYEIRKHNEQFTGRIINTHLLAKHDVAGKRVLLHAEQGIGDTLQFVRYASIIKAMGASVIVECQDGLKTILKTCPGIDDIFDRRETTTTDVSVVFDAQANLMSLPYVLKTTSLDTIPSQVPYLSTPEENKAHWEARIRELTPPDTRLKVGIVWAGNPYHRTDALRSTALEQFGALAKIDGLVCFSLQKGAKAEEQLANAPAGLRIVPLGHEFKSFGDTAAAMENLDLVIAVDTSVIHLAGAMGLPVWTLVAKSPDWRWLLERDDTPWYPTMRLFRQHEVKNWDHVFQDIVAELEVFAADPVKYQIQRALQKVEKGERDRAKVELLCIARRFPTDTRVLNTLGTILWEDGDTVEALQTFVAALQINPGDRATIRNCAQIFASFGQIADARALYMSYLSGHPEDREIVDAVANLERGVEGELALAA
jgi:tetratricopeptide (TPR) repeat protein